MRIDSFLESLCNEGGFAIGEIIVSSLEDGCFELRHHLDETVHFGALETFTHAADARTISMYDPSGAYRFAKAQTNLKQGWRLILRDLASLRHALDLFYPASIALELARRESRLESQNLRDKLNRQTGMYHFARTISDEGAQRLVREICGPAHQCARKILWQLDQDTPLEDSEASRYDGIPCSAHKDRAIPLLCREACNHFVAETRKAAKAEFEKQQSENNTAS